MARSHLPADKSSTDVAAPYQPSKFEQWIVLRLVAGSNPTAMAKLLHKKYPKRPVSTWRYRIMREVGRSPWIQSELAAVGRSELLMAVPSAASGVGRRARRGRTDAAKLVFEATGFHNPRVSHDHTGEIKITLDVPRPKRVETVDSTAEEVD